jgi:hypothetical protein
MGCYLVQFATLAHQSVISYKNYLKSIIPTAHKKSPHPVDSEDPSPFYDNAQSDAVYPYQFSSMHPDDISADGLVGGDGVDVETSFLLRV